MRKGWEILRESEGGHVHSGVHFVMFEIGSKMQERGILRNAMELMSSPVGPLLLLWFDKQFIKWDSNVPSMVIYRLPRNQASVSISPCRYQDFFDQLTKGYEDGAVSGTGEFLGMAYRLTFRSFFFSGGKNRTLEDFFWYDDMNVPDTGTCLCARLRAMQQSSKLQQESRQTMIPHEFVKRPATIQTSPYRSTA